MLSQPVVIDFPESASVWITVASILSQSAVTDFPEQFQRVDHRSVHAVEHSQISRESSSSSVRVGEQEPGQTGEVQDEDVGCKDGVNPVGALNLSSDGFCCPRLTV